MKRSFTATLILSIGLGAGVAVAAGFSAAVEEAFAKGQEDWNRGDPISAMPKLKIAADGGHPAAQSLLGYLHDQADNDALAADYYRKAAAQNDPDGIFGLANFYATGDGDVEKNDAEALRLFSKSAELGHVQSIRVVTLAYLNGGFGIDPAKAPPADVVHWLKKSVAIDLVVAMERLAKAYRNGELGLVANKEEADRIQAKINELIGSDPSNAKKKRQRR